MRTGYPRATMPAPTVTARGETGRFVRSYDALFAAWSVAAAEANLAYDAWRREPGPAAYAAFRAADDRAGAAQDALAPFS